MVIMYDILYSLEAYSFVDIMVLTVGSLFSGIGGLELGLEWTGGFRTIWQSEIEPYCCKILGKHWPGVLNLGDITGIDWGNVEVPDLVCGGFPCQDLSYAGKGRGIHAERSGLFWEMLKGIRVLRPRYVLLENVPALVTRGLDEVLGSLSECGYDAEWTIISAASVGAWHRRDRCFVLAYPSSIRCDVRRFEGEGIYGDEQTCDQIVAGGPVLADSDQQGSQGHGRPVECSREVFAPPARSILRECRERNRAGVWRSDPADVADPEGGKSGKQETGNGREGVGGRSETIRNAYESGECAVEGVYTNHSFPGRDGPTGGRKPVRRLGRVASGVPNRVDRLKSLGNAVVPQVGEVIGRMILAYDADREGSFI